MLQEAQNALYINPVHPTNAVIVDRKWFERRVAAAGVFVGRVEPPQVRGVPWRIDLAAGPPPAPAAIPARAGPPRGIPASPPPAPRLIARTAPAATEIDDMTPRPRPTPPVGELGRDGGDATTRTERWLPEQGW